MANVGSGASGKTLVGTGNGASPTYVSIGTNSGLTAHGVLIAEGNNAFVASAVGNSGQVFTSNGAGNDPTFQSVAASSISITGNDAVTLTGSAFNFLTAGSTVKFAGATLTETLNFAISNLLLGSAGASISSGTLNVALGEFAGTALSTGSDNTLIGVSAGNAINSGNTNVCVGYQSGEGLTSGTDNTLLGVASASTMTTGSSNIAIGRNALVTAATSTSNNTCVGFQTTSHLTSGNYNCTLGYESLFSCLTGAYNISIGQSSSSGYTGAESSNIIIGNAGVTGESNVMRLGTQGSSNGQITQSYLAGVLNTTSGRVVNKTTPGAYPYTTLITDDVILVDSSSARTINLIASPVTGTTYRIKDNVGSAGTNNITITPNSGNIDGSATFIINNNYQSIDITYSGSQWVIE